jgi:hypothetical protein
MCHRNIVASLKNLIADEKTKAIKLPNEQRVRIIARYHRNVETGKFWGKEFWTDLYTACVLNRILEGGMPQKTVDASNLIRIGFLLSLRKGTLWQRVSRMFLLFIVDPGTFFEKYHLNPLEELKGSGELHLYARIHVAVIDSIERLVESRRIDQETPAEEIVNQIYDLFQNTSGPRTN